jgi:selenoprotein W-related protein
MAKLDITVEYCASCNYLPRALWMAGEILSEIQFEVASLALVPGDMGVFEWKAGEETVFSKAATGRFPELEELKEAIYARLE